MTTRQVLTRDSDISCSEAEVSKFVDWCDDHHLQQVHQIKPQSTLFV